MNIQKISQNTILILDQFPCMDYDIYTILTRAHLWGVIASRQTFITTRFDENIEFIYEYSAAFFTPIVLKGSASIDFFQTRYNCSSPSFCRSKLPSHPRGASQSVRNNITSHIFLASEGICIVQRKNPQTGQSWTNLRCTQNLGRVRKWLPRKATYTEGRDICGTCQVRFRNHPKYLNPPATPAPIDDVRGRPFFSL